MMSSAESLIDPEMTQEGENLQDHLQEANQLPPPDKQLPVVTADCQCEPQEKAQQQDVVVIVNPHKRRSKEGEHPPPAAATTKNPVNAFKEMMSSQARAAEERRKKRRKHNNTEKEAPSHSSVAQRSAQVQRTANRAARRQPSEVQDNSAGTWQVGTKKTIASVLSWLNSQVSFAERGHRGLQGKWPSLFCNSDVLEPSKDPHKWLEVAAILEGTEGFDFTSKSKELAPSDFCVPDIFIWSPETHWPHLHPDGRPSCPFHGRTSCVVHKGFHHCARCGFEIGNTAIIHRCYFCKERQQKEENPYSFKGIDPNVISAAPCYVRGFWRQNGFIFTGQDAASIGLIHRMRSSLANGSGASGFRKSLVENYQRTHRSRAKMWLGHLHSIQYEVGKPAPCSFFQFDDPRSEIELPSLAWLLGVVVTMIEARIPYYEHRMSMGLGQCLSGDHSHKVAKVVLIQGQRGFMGLYTVMNEFGKILGFTFTSSTDLREVEGLLRGIAERHKLRGASGPEIFTTDRCCQEFEFFAGKHNKEERPIFESLLSTEDDASTEPAANQPRLAEVKKVALPDGKNPIVPSSLDIAELTAAQIIKDCLDNRWTVISYDSEWRIGRRFEKGPDVVQITLPDDRTFIFKVRAFGAFPKNLAKVVENEDIRKIAVQLCSDAAKLREIGIVMKGRVELAQLAKQRGVTPVARVSLDTLVELLFDCYLSKEDKVRKSDWDSPDLSAEQITYAALDAYAQMCCYKKLMTIPYTDPSKTPVPAPQNLSPGTCVILYTSTGATVATGVIVGLAVSGTTPFGEELRSTKTYSVRMSRSDVRLIGAGVPRAGNQTFAELLDEANDGLVTVPWDRKHLRINSTALQEPHEAVNIAAKVSLIPANEVDDEDDDDSIIMDEIPMPPRQIDEERYSSSSDDESSNQEGNRPRGSRRRGKKKRSRNVKNDLLHIFQRFSKVLSKQHGAFGSFMARLSDAFFVPSQDDLEFIREALRKAGLSEEDIKAKSWQYFKPRVRRHVPKPKILEQDFKCVVNLFANLEDAETGLPFFNAKAWGVYRSTLKHIRRGCLSDKTGMKYYVHIGDDSMGIPLYKCVRGTSALEGFHQKIRQLIRGFNLSPRLAIAMLYEYVHRWNHNIDVRLMGLPESYDFFYDGWEIEDEIEFSEMIAELIDSGHPDFISTKDYPPTAERFGLVRSEILESQSASTSNGIDEELEEQLLAVVDALEADQPDFVDDGDTGTSEDAAISKQGLTASAAWIGAQFGRSRPQTPVATKEEKEFCEQNYHRFPNNGSEADNYSGICWTKFSDFFNRVIDDEEKGLRETTNMNYKTAYDLQAWHREFKKTTNTAATLLPVSNNVNAMRRNWRSGVGERSEVPVPAAASRTEWVDAAPDASDNDDDGFDCGYYADDDCNDPSDVRPLLSVEEQAAGIEIEIRPTIQEEPLLTSQCQGRAEAADADAAAVAAAAATVAAAAAAVPAADVAEACTEPDQPSRPRNSRRCRACGHPYGNQHAFGAFHSNRGKIGTKQAKPEDVCSVPENLREPGFPLKPGEPFPRSRHSN